MAHSSLSATTSNESFKLSLMGDIAKSKPVVDASQARKDEQNLSQALQYEPRQSQTSYPCADTYSHHNTWPMRPESFKMIALGTTLPNHQDYNSFAHGLFTSPLAPAYQLQHAQNFVASPMGHSGANMQCPDNFNRHNQGQFVLSHTLLPQTMQTGVSNSWHRYNDSGFTIQPQQQWQYYCLPQHKQAPQYQVYPIMLRSQCGGRGALMEDQNHHLDRRFRGQAVAFGAGERLGILASSVGQSSVVRGPPRKPHQSGHAIWIGNLPPQTDLMTLVLHVGKESCGLESLFLIPKSNCAFANYKDGPTCAQAQAKIHDSQFQSLRLVSRMKRTSVSRAVVRTGTAESGCSPNSLEPRASSYESEDNSKYSEAVVEVRASSEYEEVDTPKDKFFILKSSTVEDLELSVRNGIWATQSHNEEALSKAFQNTENVYLVFSANKSGEYFGYARMTSAINDDPAAAIELAPKLQAVEGLTVESPKTTPTLASEYFPAGRIIDDSTRGTIFWEAERDESEEANGSEQDGMPAAKPWQRPFKVDWISNSRLPFYRTRGLRNPWNSNREVKIARDGTELETSVGKRLLALFHQAPNSTGPRQIFEVQMMRGYSSHMRALQ